MYDSYVQRQWMDFMEGREKEMANIKNDWLCISKYSQKTGEYILLKPFISSIGFHDWDINLEQIQDHGARVYLNPVSVSQ